MKYLVLILLAILMPQFGVAGIDTTVSSSNCQNVLSNGFSESDFKELSDDFLTELYLPSSDLEKLDQMAHKLFETVKSLLEQKGWSYFVEAREDGRPRIKMDLRKDNDFLRYLNKWTAKAPPRVIYFDPFENVVLQSEAAVYDGTMYLSPENFLMPPYNPSLVHESKHLFLEFKSEHYPFEGTSIDIKDYSSLIAAIPSIDLPREYTDYFSFSEIVCYRDEMEEYSQWLKTLMSPSAPKDLLMETQKNAATTSLWGQRITNALVAILENYRVFHWKRDDGIWKAYPLPESGKVFAAPVLELYLYYDITDLSDFRRQMGTLLRQARQRSAKLNDVVYRP